MSLAVLSMTPSNLTVRGNIYAIERMGMFDGPGVRYVLFLQGCPFKCKFCHNRDSWSTADNKMMTVEDVLSDFKKYQAFYKKGGLTVSGGEPLLQLDFLIALFQTFKAEGIHTTLDTSGGLFTLVNKEKYAPLLAVTDLVLLDIKHIDNEEHLRLVGTHNKNILDFARYLSEEKIPVVIRHVLIPGITLDETHLLNLRAFLDTLTNVTKIEILAYHTKGIRKWKALGLEYPLSGAREPTKEEVRFAEGILQNGYQFNPIQ